MILAKESPYAAWRPCATVIGPVGLTLTNSSRIASPEGSPPPYPPPAESNTFSSSSKAPEDNQKLMNPGPATSTFSRKGAYRASAIPWATSSGLRLKILAFASATFVAKSPWTASFGRSTWMPFNSRPGLLFPLQKLPHQPPVLGCHPLGRLLLMREAHLGHVPRLHLTGQQLPRHIQGTPPFRIQWQHRYPVGLRPDRLHLHTRV